MIGVEIRSDHIAMAFPTSLQYVLLERTLIGTGDRMGRMACVAYRQRLIRLGDIRRVDTCRKSLLNSFVAAPACHGNVQRVHTGRRIAAW